MRYRHEKVNRRMTRTNINVLSSISKACYVKHYRPHARSVTPYNNNIQGMKGLIKLCLPVLLLVDKLFLLFS